MTDTQPESISFLFLRNYLIPLEDWEEKIKTSVPFIKRIILFISLTTSWESDIRRLFICFYRETWQSKVPSSGFVGFPGGLIIWQFTGKAVTSCAVTVQGCCSRTLRLKIRFSAAILKGERERKRVFVIPYLSINMQHHTKASVRSAWIGNTKAGAEHVNMPTMASPG